MTTQKTEWRGCSYEFNYDSRKYEHVEAFAEFHFEPKRSSAHKLLYVIFRSGGREHYFNALDLFAADEIPILSKSGIKAARTAVLWWNERYMENKWGARWLVFRCEYDKVVVSNKLYEQFLRIQDDLPAEQQMIVLLLRHRDDVSAAVRIVNEYSTHLPADMIAEALYRYVNPSQCVLDRLRDDIGVVLLELIEDHQQFDDPYSGWMEYGSNPDF